MINLAGLPLFPPENSAVFMVLVILINFVLNNPRKTEKFVYIASCFLNEKC